MFNLKRSLIVICFIMLTITQAQAGSYIANGTVKEVSNVASNTPAFAIIVDGTGICAGQWIPFYPENFLTENNTEEDKKDAYKRAYANALLAMTNEDLKVSVHNYTGSSCDGASYLSLYRE